MANMEIDNERFIEEVHIRPVLWDISLEEYKDRTKTKAAWTSIVEAIIPKVTNAKEKEDLARDFQMKWRNLRDALIRSERNLNTHPVAGGGKAKKKYRYSKQMAFLKKNIMYTHSNRIRNMEELVKCEEKEDEQVLHIKNEDTLSSGEAVSRNSNFEEHIDYGITDSIGPIGQRLDDDMCFFQSLLPTVKMLDSNQKLTFRINVMSLLQKQISQNYS
ncbi:hypothetical protein HHI36_004099 [Cryptolaemus montrouzieri]|uniref:MADF domain-containing protein n=1 Tax=Cryptolaemus montrouzieri TaxID=559131 RepID=A0ABD2NR66_9CUCU